MDFMSNQKAMNPQSYAGGFDNFSQPTASAAPSNYYEYQPRQQGGGYTRDPAEQERINAFMDAEDAQDAASGDPAGTTRGARITSDLGPIANALPYGGLVMGLSDAFKGFQDPRDTSNTSIGSEIGRTIGGFFNSGPGYESGPAGRISIGGKANLDAMRNEGGGGGYTSLLGGGDGRRDAGGNTGEGATNSAESGGWGSRDAGGNFYKGGKVTMDRLQGPNPMGPDDGYGGLDDGEYVINAKSVGKYGIELMNAINAGKIPKGKLRGLLEA